MPVRVDRASLRSIRTRSCSWASPVELRALPGVREAAALMGTPANHELLAAAGLATPEIKTRQGLKI